MQPAPIVFGQPGRPVAGHGAGQKAGGHWGVSDYSNTFAQAVRENLVFDLAVHQRIRRLQRSYWSDGLRAFQLLNVEVGDSDPADLAFALQGGERRPSFLERGRIGIGRPMNLVEIDHVDGKTAEAVFDFLPDRTGAQDFLHLTIGVPAQAAFREDVRPRAGPAFKGPTYDFFGVSQAVDGGGVDPVDAEFEGAVNGGDGVVVVLRSPGELPAGTAGGPGAEADGSDFHIGVAKLAGLHFNLLIYHLS